MLSFPVPPDYCLILKALNDTNTLREAARYLDYDPGALARKISRISDEYGLVHKVENKWVLTEQGRRLVQWVDESSSLQKELLAYKPVLRLGAYAWMMESLLVPHFSALERMTRQECDWSFNVLKVDEDREMLDSRLDFLFSARPPFSPEISHRRLPGKNWCIVTPAAWSNELSLISKTDLISQLKKKPFIQRKKYDIATAIGFDPEVFSSIQIEGVTGISTAVACGYGWACLPELGVLREIKDGKIIKLNLPVSEFGEIYLWWLRSRKDLKGRVKILEQWFISLLEDSCN